MHITLKETLKLDIFSEFHLVAGEKGLNRLVSRIGLLDHEMINPIKGQFVEGEFALSTLLAAKEQPELIYTSVEYLIECGSSGLGVKDIFFKELPSEVLTLAEANDFPIFMFDNSVYFEDIITDFKTFIDRMRSEEMITSSFESILETSVSNEKIMDVFQRVMGAYNGRYQIEYLRFKDTIPEEAFLALKGHQLTKRLLILFTAVYKGGLFIVHKVEESFDLEALLEQESFGKRTDYLYGQCAIYEKGLSFRNALIESLTNCRIAEVENLSNCRSDQRGVYQLIAAFGDRDSFQAFKDLHLEPILRYDQSNNTTLLETVVAFVQNEGEIKATAKAMVQHDNTIRYRLSKVRSLLAIEGSDSVLYERLSIAVKLYLLEQLNY